METVEEGNQLCGSEEPPKENQEVNADLVKEKRDAVLEEQEENEEQRQARKKEAIIAARRCKVWELYSKGWSQTEIALKLDVSDATVHRDVKFLTDEAWAKQEDSTNQIFIERQKALAGITLTIRKLWEIVEDEKRSPAERMQALSMMLKAYDTRLGMVSGKNAGKVLKGEQKLMEIYEEQRDRALVERGKALKELENEKEMVRRNDMRVSFAVDAIAHGELNAENIRAWYKKW